MNYYVGKMNFVVRSILLFLLAISFAFAAKAEVLKIQDARQLKEPFPLVPYTQFFEDQKKVVTINNFPGLDSCLLDNHRFVPQRWNSTYWAKVVIENGSGTDWSFSLSFRNLTFVELCEFRGDSLTARHLSGLFQNKKEIIPGDGLDHFDLNLKANEQVVYYLKIDHTKGYKPNLVFALQDSFWYHEQKNRSERFNFLILGAFLTFFLYCLIGFFVSRYRPFLWLSFFVLGLALYGFNLSGFFQPIFPNHPELIWRLNNLFTTISSIGGILLVSDFFELERLFRKGYVVLKILVVFEMVQFVLGQLIIEFFNNYWFLTVFVIFISLLTLPLIVYISLRVWKKLTAPQKVFSWAVYLYASIVAVALLLLFVFKEDSLTKISFLSNLCGAVTILFFTLSLNEQMRGAIVERNSILLEINKLKNEQNKILEEQVNQRTGELREINQELMSGKEILLQRNNRIELLLRELHHRVKNNLQLISSFYELRRYDLNYECLNETLDDGQNRIQIMAMVHDMLYHSNGSDAVNLNAFINQVVIFLNSNFDLDRNFVPVIECPELNFDMDTAIPLGLILNELLSSIYKYAIGEEDAVDFSIVVAPIRDHVYSLVVSNNGDRIEEDIISGESQWLGFHLIYLLSKQLNGNFTYKYDEKNIFIVNFMDTEGWRQIP